MVDASSRQLHAGERVHLCLEVRMEDGPFPGRCVLLQGWSTALRWQELDGEAGLNWAIALRLDAPLAIEGASPRDLAL